MSVTTKFLDLFLLTGGVIRDSDYRIYERIVTIIITVASFVSWYGTLVATVNISKVVDKFETVFFFVAAPSCYFASYQVRKHRLKLSQFIELIQKLSRDDDNGVMKNIDSSCRNISKKVSIALCATVVFFSLPLWITLFSHDHRTTKSFVPRWLECAENETAYRFTINVLCLRVDSYAKRVSSNFIQWVFCWVYSMPAISAILFYVFIYQYVKFYRRYLQNTLDQIRARRQVAFFTRGERGSQQIRSDLVDVMKQYQSLYRRVWCTLDFYPENSSNIRSYDNF